MLLLAVASSASCQSARPAAALQECDGPVFRAARQLRESGLHDEAATLARSVLKAETAPCAAAELTRIETARKEQASFSNWPAQAASAISARPLLALALACLVLAALYRLCSWLLRSSGGGRWRIHQVEAGSNRGILSAWHSALAGLGGGGAASAGLLSGQAVPIPQPVMIGPSSGWQIEDLLKDAPSVQGISVSWIGRIVAFLTRRIHSPRRSLSLAATVGPKSAMLRVDVVSAENQLRSIAESAEWQSEANAAREIDRMARVVALRTNYLLNGGSGEVVEAHLKLQEGMEHLNDFVTRNASQALEQAASAFAEARRRDWADMNAAFYEGVARELQEDHDRAESLFNLVIERDQSGDALRVRARYNLAVSHLRRYTPESLAEAGQMLDDLINQSKLEPAEIKSFARAVKANVIAHRFIFWKSLLDAPEGPPAGWPAETATGIREKLQAWSTEIERLIRVSKAAIDDKKSPLERGTQIQLEWLLENAKGNHALNRAKYAADLALPPNDDRNKMLEAALDAYRRCEALIPAGVETLTNIATALIALGRPTDALVYTGRARELNNAYEYAYYREAEALLARGDEAECKKFLAKAKGALRVIRISSFRSIFDRMQVAYRAT